MGISRKTGTGTVNGYKIGPDADLTDADLRDADLTDADLRDADLSGADLHGANLSDADLHGANLSDADLTDANLINANLERADFRFAILTNANLERANLINANFYAVVADRNNIALFAEETQISANRIIQSLVEVRKRVENRRAPNPRRPHR